MVNCYFIFGSSLHLHMSSSLFFVNKSWFECGKAGQRLKWHPDTHNMTHLVTLQTAIKCFILACTLYCDPDRKNADFCLWVHSFICTWPREPQRFTKQVQLKNYKHLRLSWEIHAWPVYRVALDHIWYGGFVRKENTTKKVFWCFDDASCFL